jgi:hypothetical protein
MTKTDTWQTRPLVREGAPKRQNSNFEEREKIWLNVPRFGLDTKTYWLTVSHNVTLTLTLTWEQSLVTMRDTLSNAIIVKSTLRDSCHEYWVLQRESGYEPLLSDVF